MRFYQADLVFPLEGPPLEKGIVIISDDGIIEDVISPLRKDPGIHPEFLEGVLVPGFVNTHCHLELSCMKGHIAEHTGMLGFVREFISKRNNFSAAEKTSAIAAAEAEMLENGIVAIGDISNTTDTLEQKRRGRLYYHTFVEAFDLHPSRAEVVFDEAKAIYEAFSSGLSPDNGAVSLVPHAPYTVSPSLYEKIKELAADKHAILSVHNQESKAENELFQLGTGPFIDMYARMGMDHSWFKPTRLSSLLSTLGYYPSDLNLLLVHNTFTSEEDIKEGIKRFGKNKLFWATCPKANLYIENTLPDYEAFVRSGAKMTIGTDSLASNTSLSVLEEMKMLSARFPSLSLDQLLTWACKNGADFLGISERFGTLEKGKQPGLVWISNVENKRLTAESQAKRIV
jgi:cytosine/adenosine deaminase-related metal-dependent hydrolase